MVQSLPVKYFKLQEHVQYNNFTFSSTKNSPFAGWRSKKVDGITDLLRKEGHTSLFGRSLQNFHEIDKDYVCFCKLQFSARRLTRPKATWSPLPTCLSVAEIALA